MIIKVIIHKTKENDLVTGAYILETYSKDFVEELNKYVCPQRMVDFLIKEEKKSFRLLKEDIDEKDIQQVIDLSDKTDAIIRDKVAKGEILSVLSHESYIESTPHLNKYGN